MEVVYGSERLSAQARAVAIGNFDGVHLGHRQVLDHLLTLSKGTGASPWVYTFDPPPTVVIAPERHQPRLVTLAHKLELLAGLGVSGVVVEPFTAAFAAQSAEMFAREVLRGRLGASAVAVGWDFRFGSGRGGDVDALRAALPGVDVTQVAPLLRDGEPVSSSRIRRLIQAGDLDAAAAFLDRPHRLSGTVVHGDARGRTIGFPTANIANEVECLPALGVYAVRARLPDGIWRPAALNLGVRPTFNGVGQRVEVHILDWAGDAYGQPLDVDIVRRIRGEQRFPSMEALVAQIRADIVACRAILV